MAMRMYFDQKGKVIDDHYQPVAMAGLGEVASSSSAVNLGNWKRLVFINSERSEVSIRAQPR